MSRPHEALGDGDAEVVPRRAAAPPATPTRHPDIVLCSLMRHAGDTGVQTYVQAVEHHLRRRGRHQTFVNPFTGASRLRPVVFAVRYILRPLSRPLGVRWYRYWHAWYLERALAHVVREAAPDAVLFAQCPVSAGVALRVRTTQPVVMAVHFNLSQADEWVGKGDLVVGDPAFRAIRAFEETVLPRLDGIVYISAFARRATLERIPALEGVPSEVVHGSVVAHADLPTRIPVPAKGDLVTVGTLEPRKNQAYLLQVLAEAARRGHRYSLTVVGDGPERGRLEELARRLGLAEQVRFLGYVANARSVMARHRVYCHAATMESFGLVFLEAMAEGLPVLTGEVGGVPEIIRPGVDGEFWTLQDAAAAAALLVTLLEDPARLEAMGRAARDRSAEEFDPESTGDLLLSVLDAAADRRLGPLSAAA